MPDSIAVAVDTAILANELVFRWHKHHAATLDIPELRIVRGEKIFIAGPSGSGKTTLLNLLTGINRPSSGALNVLGQPLQSLSNAQRDRFRCDHVGVIFQQFNLLPYLSVLENVILSCRFSKRRQQDINARQQTPATEARRLLAALHIDAELHHRPIHALSVGQQQRVAAARAFMGSPEIIIADEPTSALDDDRQQAFIDLLKAQCQRTGATLIFVSHNRALQTHFDRVIALRDIQRQAPVDTRAYTTLPQTGMDAPANGGPYA